MERAESGSWLEAEPAMAGSLARELSRSWRRARRCLIPITSVAVAAAAGAGALAATRTPSYTATATVALATDGDGDREPASSGELRTYLEDVVFASDRLLPVIDRHFDRHFATSAGSRQRDLADFREQMKAEVQQPDLIEAREAPDLQEPARLTLSFTASTPELSQAVLGSLLALVSESESRDRRATAQGEASAARAALEKARLRWERVSLQARRGDLRGKQELVAAAQAIKAASVQLAEAELDAERAPATANLRFRVLDSGRPPRPAPPPWGRFARTSLLGLPALWIGCALLWGDRRLFTADDVAAAGVPLLAHIVGVPPRGVS